MKATHLYYENLSNRQIANRALKAMEFIQECEQGTIRKPCNLASVYMCDGRTLIETIYMDGCVTYNDGYYIVEVDENYMYVDVTALAIRETGITEMVMRSNIESEDGAIVETLNVFEKEVTAEQVKATINADGLAEVNNAALLKLIGKQVSANCYFTRHANIEDGRATFKVCFYGEVRTVVVIFPDPAEPETTEPEPTYKIQVKTNEYQAARNISFPRGCGTIWANEGTEYATKAEAVQALLQLAIYNSYGEPMAEPAELISGLIWEQSRAVGTSEAEYIKAHPRLIDRLARLNGWEGPGVYEAGRLIYPEGSESHEYDGYYYKVIEVTK